MSAEPTQLSLDLDLPLIYVASALSWVDGEARELMTSWFDSIERSVRDEVAENIAVHIPGATTAPWVDGGLDPEAVYDANVAKVCYQADGLIVLGFAGGSLGAGQEFDWACSLRMPILYLRRDEEPMSRQIQGTPVDLQVAQFHNSHDLGLAVRSFVRARRGAIEAHARRRHARLIELLPLLTAIQKRWAALDYREEERVVAEAHLHRRRIQHLSTQPMALAAASLDELLALTGALGLDLGPLLMAEPLPQLSGEEIAALDTAAAEYGWSGGEVLDVLKYAQLERPRGGVRRLRFATVEDWKRFRDRRRG
jgi:hypothetical protein